MSKARKKILITNDDGVYGPGLSALREALKSLGDIVVIVPDQERSTASHSLTLHKPLRFQELGDNFYILNGTPADCTRFGILHLLKKRVDLIVAGINSGVNLGEDVIYSGTVASALEGTMLGIPTIAVSRPPSSKPKDFVAAAHVAHKVAGLVLKHGLPPGIALNVNVPPTGKDQHVKGIRVAHLGHRLYGKKVTIRQDPRGNRYYWLLSKRVLGVPTPGSDVEAFNQGYATVTPLGLDWTAHSFTAELEAWRL